MPRATTTPASKVLDLFKSLELPVAELLLELVLAAVKDRQTKSREAKARAAQPKKSVATTPAMRAMLRPAPAAPKKKARKKAPKPVAPPAQA